MPAGANPQVPPRARTIAASETKSTHPDQVRVRKAGASPRTPAEGFVLCTPARRQSPSGHPLVWVGGRGGAARPAPASPLRPLFLRPSPGFPKGDRPLAGVQRAAPSAGVRGEAPALPAMNPAWVVRTARLVLTPVVWRDLPELAAIK